MAIKIVCDVKIMHVNYEVQAKYSLQSEGQQDKDSCEDCLTEGIKGMLQRNHKYPERGVEVRFLVS